MNDSQRLRFLAGEVAALRAFAFAVVSTTPELQKLSDEFHRLCEVQLTLSTPEPGSEAYLDGQRQTADELKAYLANKLAE
jgi:hypothetical protein